MLKNAARRRFTVTALTLVVLAFASPALASTIITREFKSATLARSWAYAVYLPTGYDDSDLRYPVLYLLHGNDGNRYQWVDDGRIQQTADTLIARNEIPPAIIVMPDAGTSWYVDRTEKMETAVIRDLIPDVERNFRALADRDARLVAGLSMGGYGAMRFALKYPDVFRAAALLSPSIYNPEPPLNSAARIVGVFGSPAFDAAIWKSLNYPALWDAFLAQRRSVPMYIISGDDDEFFIEFEAAQFYELLRKNQQIAELRIVNGTHSWSVWWAATGDALKYIFSFSSRPQ